MKNLFEKNTFEEVISRIHKLNRETEPLWGKMNAAQMQAPINVALSDKPMPRIFIGRLIGWMIKPKLYNETPWKKNLPTAPDFIIKDERDFAKEQLRLLELIEQFYTTGPEGVGKYPHPMFGSFTKEQWGKSKFKVQCSKFNVQCSKFNVQCSKFNVQSSMFKVQCSMFNVQCSKNKG